MEAILDFDIYFPRQYIFMYYKTTSKIKKLFFQSDLEKQTKTVDFYVVFHFTTPCIINDVTYVHKKLRAKKLP